MNEQYVTFSQLKYVLDQLHKSLELYAPCDGHPDAVKSQWDMIFTQVKGEVDQLEWETKIKAGL